MRTKISPGRWMISTPGTPGGVVQHYIPPLTATRPYALSHAYVAPCDGHPLCIPADDRYRRDIPLCPACSRLRPRHP